MTGDTSQSFEPPDDYLTTMPAEVLVRILIFIDDGYAHRDILSLERTCRAFWSLLQNDNIWGLFRGDPPYCKSNANEEETHPPTNREGSFFKWCWGNIYSLGVDFDCGENLVLKYLGGIDGVRCVTSKLVDAMRPPPQHDAVDNPTILPLLQDDAILYLVEVIKNSVVLRLRKAYDLVVGSQRLGDGYPIVTANDLKRLDNIFLPWQEAIKGCSIPLGSHYCKRCFCNSDTQFWTWPEHNCCDDEFLGELDRCKLVRALAFTAEIVKFSGDVISTISAEILHDMAELVSIAIDEFLTNEVAVADAGTVINSDNNDVTMGATRFRLVQHNCVITRLQIKRAAESVGMRNIMGLRYLSDVWSPYDDSFYNELDDSHPESDDHVSGTASTQLLPNDSIIGTTTSSSALIGDNAYSFEEPCYLTIMPEEALKRILLFIDDKDAHRDVLSLERTCWAFRNLLQNDNVWVLCIDDRWRKEYLTDNVEDTNPPKNREMAFFKWCWSHINDETITDENLVLKYLGGLNGVRRVTSKVIDAMMLTQHTADHPTMPRLRNDAILYLVKVIENSLLLRLTRTKNLVVGSLRTGDDYPTVTADDMKRLDSIFLMNQGYVFDDCSIPHGSHYCTRCFCDSDTQFWTWPKHNCQGDEFLGELDRCKLVRALAFKAGIVKFSGDVISTISAEILHDMAVLVSVAVDIIFFNGPVDGCRMTYEVTDDSTDINSNNNEMRTMNDDNCRLGENEHLITRRHIKKAAEIVGLTNEKSVKYISDVWGSDDGELNLEPDESIPESDGGSESDDSNLE